MKDIKKKIKQIKEKLKQKIDIWNQYHNPLYYWWKVRKEFKRPKCHFIYGKDLWFFGLYINKNFYNKFIHFRMSGLGWKWKYDEVRHEWDPYIQIVFLRKYHLIWVFNWINPKDKDSYTRSMATWEAILQRIYCKDDLHECIKNNIWGNKDEFITIIPNTK